MDDLVDWSHCSPARIRTDSVTTGAESPDVQEDAAASEKLHTARQYALQNAGRCISIQGEIDPSAVFQCKEGHTFTRSLSNLTWCDLCECELEKMRKFALSRGGKCLSIRFGKRLDFECEKGHRWSTKNAHSRWCRTCAKSQYRKNKLFQKSVDNKNRSELEREQRALFDEARCTITNKSESAAIAKQQALNYLQECEIDTKCTYTKVFRVYQVMEMPLDMLRVILQVNSKQFRHFAKDIHPDKNSHPMASLAFKKLVEAYKH